MEPPDYTHTAFFVNVEITLPSAGRAFTSNALTSWVLAEATPTYASTPHMASLRSGQQQDDTHAAHHIGPATPSREVDLFETLHVYKALVIPASSRPLPAQLVGSTA